jgi:D-alanyl-lipoteichoic acid acyltransferase DltB (MBOAT superfamily)
VKYVAGPPLLISGPIINRQFYVEDVFSPLPVVRVTNIRYVIVILPRER